MANLSTTTQASPGSAKSLTIAGHHTQPVDPNMASTSNKGKSQIPIHLSSYLFASCVQPRARVLPTPPMARPTEHTKKAPKAPPPISRGGMPIYDDLDELEEAQRYEEEYQPLIEDWYNEREEVEEELPRAYPRHAQ